MPDLKKTSSICPIIPPKNTAPIPRVWSASGASPWADRKNPNPRPGPSRGSSRRKERVMKGLAAWFLGVPIVVIILLYVTGIF
jgi:hypothetical protein